MGNQNIEKLEVIHNEMLSEIDSCSSCRDCVNSLKKEFYIFSEIIKNFFTGKQEEIKSIYKSIKENAFPYNKMNVVDIDSAVTLYNDYFTGMLEYVKKINSLKDTDMVDEQKVYSTIQRIGEKDEEYINSIFGGDKNQSVELSLDSAMKNIEALITIDSDFNKYIAKASNACASSGDCKKYRNSIQYCVKTCIKSISYFNYKCIKSILKDYEVICDSIKTRTPVGGERVVPTYQMF